MKILTCNANRPLADNISAILGVPLTQASVKRFSDMEIFVEVHENVRGQDVFVIQPTSYPAHDHLMDLLVMIDALRRGSAQRCLPLVLRKKHQTRGIQHRRRQRRSSQQRGHRQPAAAGRPSTVAH
jgi:phosphoribosylpyrophosphate synthetase